MRHPAQHQSTDEPPGQLLARWFFLEKHAHTRVSALRLGHGRCREVSLGPGIPGAQAVTMRQLGVDECSVWLNERPAQAPAPFAISTARAATLGGPRAEAAQFRVVFIGRHG